MNIDNLTTNDIKVISSIFAQLGASQEEPTQSIDNFAAGEIVIVRTLSAGVWCGYLSKKSKDEVVLVRARRMWGWHCKESISLSGVVAYGINRDKSKIAPPVPTVWLEAIEIMPITGDAAKSIMEAEIVQAS